MSVEYSEDMEEALPAMEWEDNLIKEVLKEMDKKPEEVRQALYLYIFKQYKPREIAQVVNMSNTYIRTSVKEFKQEMRKKYGDLFGVTPTPVATPKIMPRQYNLMLRSHKERILRC
jgi:DNA-directed RNA polymerase specialized sigma24 family protein